MACFLLRSHRVSVCSFATECHAVCVFIHIGLVKSLQELFHRKQMEMCRIKPADIHFLEVLCIKRKCQTISLITGNKKVLISKSPSVLSLALLLHLSSNGNRGTWSSRRFGSSRHNLSQCESWKQRRSPVFWNSYSQPTSFLNPHMKNI